MWEKLKAILKTDLAIFLLKLLLTAATAGGTVVTVARHVNPFQTPPILKRLRPFSSNPAEAIGRITFGRSGCTATIVGPVYDDDAKISILTAAHCVDLGAKGRMKLKDGREFDVVCVTHDKSSDAAWLSAAMLSGEVPNVALAMQTPKVGEVVWHQGYGIDKPNNREQGTFSGLTSNGKQCMFRLSVSPGDSGGGIMLNSSGEILSPVCCTTRLAGLGDAFGACPQEILALRPSPRHAAEDIVLIHPIMPVPHADWPEPIQEKAKDAPPYEPPILKK